MPKLIIRLAPVAVGLILAGALVAILIALPTGFPPPLRSSRAVLRMACANLAFDNTDPLGAANVVERLEADLLILLEWTGENIDPALLSDPAWQKLLDEPRIGAHGVMVLARRPIRADASLAPTPILGPCPLPIATVRLRAGADWLSVLGVHAPPPIEECEGTNAPTLEFFAELVEDGRLAEDLGVSRRGDRVVMAGDFNARPNSAGISAIRSRGLVDTHTQRRWLPIGTWTSSERVPHLIRIDYILVSRELRVVGSWTVNLPGSDHRAVIADLAYRE